MRGNNFLSGTNVPWISFARDIVDFPEDSEKAMEQALKEVSLSGGNAIRWWLHTNGCHSPSITNGKVSGLDEKTVPIIRKVLDMALAHRVGISLCLWSFDMLQDQGQNVAAMKHILENTYYTECYIQHALIPLLEQLGSHPAILTWEIFNEAEGMTDLFGWSKERTQMCFIQQTVNLIAGAIHRHAPGVPVSTGAWNIKVMTDVDGHYNYYRDDRLIGAGKDKDGYLDLYQVHYYPEHFAGGLSPFHQPASYWSVNKPLMIGEFPNKGCSYGLPSLEKKSTEESFLYALKNGYTGCLTWRWPYEENMGTFTDDAKPALQAVADKIDQHRLTKILTP
jgi:hypothetical protein